MNAIMTSALLAGAAFVQAATPAKQEANQAPPRWVTAVCMNCHGLDGNSTSPLFPCLAGQRADYIERQLKAYRDHSRANQAARNYMWGMARMLGDEDIRQLAGWFSTSAPTPKVSESLAAGSNLGWVIYHQGISDRAIPACASCHGAHGEGSPTAPRLAGQHAYYLETQLKVIAAGQRPMAATMQDFAGRLGDDEMRAVAGYLQGMD